MDFLIYLVLALVAFALGYIARKYVEKRYPTEAALLDAVATKYGEDAKNRLKSYSDKIAGRDEAGKEQAP